MTPSTEPSSRGERQAEILKNIDSNPLFTLKKYGFCIIRQVISTAEVALCRKHCEENTSFKDTSSVPSAFLATPIICEIPFQEHVIAALSKIYEQAFIIYPNFTIRKNVYVPWHTDVAFQGDLGGFEAQCDFLQCVVYFQDNGSAGGGLDVIPGSHRRYHINGEFYAPAHSLDIFGNSFTIPSQAGDLIIFDGRLLHASTGIGNKLSSDKLGVFWTTSKMTGRSEDHLKHLRNRNNVRKLDGTLVHDPRFSDMQNIKFPEHFSQKAIKAVAANKIKICTL